MTLTNYVICTAMAAWFSGFGSLIPKTEGIGFTLGLGVVTGALYLAGLILLLLISGFCDGMSKVHEELGRSDLSEQFLLYTFFVALVLCAVLILVKKEKVGIKDIGFGILLGVPNYFSCRFLLKSLSSVPAVIAYPTFSVAAVVIITLAGVLVFKERLNKKQWLAIGLILLALALLNI